MKKRIGLLVVVFAPVLLLSLVLVSAQQQEAPPGPGPQSQGQPLHPPMDPLGDAMFPPDMIMQHARALDLTQEQKSFMRNEIQKTTTRFIELQWQLQDVMDALHETMKANSVNEQQALAQLDKVLDVEREIKRLHIGMGIRIKNQLTAEQQTKLQSMIHSMMGPALMGPAMMGPGRHGPGRGPGPGGPGGAEHGGPEQRAPDGPPDF
jgi:Spy/CpxP family protein refolding chaperone